jgi:hypothetical protein
VALAPSSYHHAVLPAKLHSGTTTSIHDASPSRSLAAAKPSPRDGPAVFPGRISFRTLEDSLKTVWAVVVVVVEVARAKRKGRFYEEGTVTILLANISTY